MGQHLTLGISKIGNGRNFGQDINMDTLNNTNNLECLTKIFVFASNMLAYE